PALPAGPALSALPAPTGDAGFLTLEGGNLAGLAPSARTLPVTSFQFDLHNTRPLPGTGGPAGVGKTSFDALDVTVDLSQLSPALFATLTGGDHYTTAKLVVTDSAGHNVVVWTLGIVSVADVTVTGEAGSLPTETLGLAYGAIRQDIPKPGGKVTSEEKTW